MTEAKETARKPGGPNVAGQPTHFDPVAEAKLLLRTIRSGSLATLDASGGPFASLVGVATAADGAPLFLMSALSVHTKNLFADPRAALLLSRGGKGDPLAHARLTVSGRAERSEDPALMARYLSRHPKAGLYAGFGDFAIWRMEISAGHLNGGYARAAGIGVDELMTDVTGADDLLQNEASAVAHMNEDHAEATRLYAVRLLRKRPGKWRISGIDPDGLDLMLGDETARLAFAKRVTSGRALRLVLKDLADQARALNPT